MVGDAEAHEVFELIGQFICHFSVLEQSVRLYLIDLLRVADDKGTMAALILTNEMTFNAKVDALQAILKCELKGIKTAVANIKALRRKLDTVRDRRNDIAHSSFGYSPVGRGVIQIRTKARGSWTVQDCGHIKPNNLRKWIEDVNEAIFLLQDFKETFPTRPSNATSDSAPSALSKV